MAARTLEAPGATQGRSPAEVEYATFWEELKRRRFPQFVGGSVLAAVGIISFVIGLEDVGRLSAVWVDLSFPLTASGVAAAIVLAWFHGERGTQESGPVEWVLLGIIGVAWLASSAWILLD